MTIDFFGSHRAGASFTTTNSRGTCGSYYASTGVGDGGVIQQKCCSTIEIQKSQKKRKRKRKAHPMGSFSFRISRSRGYNGHSRGDDGHWIFGTHCKYYSMACSVRMIEGVRHRCRGLDLDDWWWAPSLTPYCHLYLGSKPLSASPSYSYLFISRFIIIRPGGQNNYLNTKVLLRLSASPLVSHLLSKQDV